MNNLNDYAENMFFAPHHPERRNKKSDEQTDDKIYRQIGARRPLGRQGRADRFYGHVATQIFPALRGHGLGNGAG